MIVVDTTVLVYAVGGDHALRLACSRLVEAVSHGRLRASTTPEVIQEFVHARARRRSRTDAAELGRAFATVFAPLLVVEDEDLRAGLDLFAQADALGAFDTVLVAVAVGRGASAVASADRAFGSQDSVAHLNPQAPDFLEQAMRLAGTGAGA